MLRPPVVLIDVHPDRIVLRSDALRGERALATPLDADSPFADPRIAVTDADAGGRALSRAVRALSAELPPHRRLLRVVAIVRLPGFGHPLHPLERRALHELLVAVGVKESYLRAAASRDHRPRVGPDDEILAGP